MTRTPTEPSTDGEVRRRIGAYLVDVLAVLGAVASLLNVREKLSIPRATAVLAVGGVVAFPYHILLEGATGRTLGKAAFGIRVVRADGAPCTYRAAAIRTLLRFVDWMPAAYLAGLVSIALTRRGQRLGDVAAGTVVVRAGGAREESRDGE